MGLCFGLQNSCVTLVLFCALVCAFSCAVFWSLWLGLCSCAFLVLPFAI